MKNHLLKFLLILLISTFVESDIIINNITNYECQNFTGITIFSLDATTDSYLPETERFNLKVGNISINCSFPESQQNKTSFDDIGSDSSSYTEEESSYFSDVTDESLGTDDWSDDSSLDSSTSRLLQESDNKALIGVCMILGEVKESITLNNNNTKIVNNNKNISFKDGFSYSLNKCTDTVDKTNEFDLSISFQQLSNFDKNSRKITFLFFGSVTSSLPKGYPIDMDVYLIRNGFQDQNSTKANCTLNNDIIGGNGPVSGQFNCSIENINGSEIDSFVFDKSDYIAGVPNDKIFLNPALSDIYIVLQLIYDFLSGIIDPVKRPSFRISGIDHTNCGEGKFTLKGNMSDNFTKNVTFELPISKPENVTASCSINETAGNVQINIECQTNSKIDNSQIQIAQNSIFDENKKEIFLIEKFVSPTFLNCNNSKIISLERIVEYSISFRQVSNYELINKELSFKFIGLAFKSVKKGDEIHFKVLLINNNKQITKDITCSSENNVNPADGDYAQVIYNCKADVELDNLNKVVIISSNDVSGLENIQDYQKDPIETDQFIKDTEKNSESGVGKVIDYSQKSSYVPILEIISINTDKCIKKGKITIKGVFNQDITKKFDFEIPLSYPSSTIRCTAPITKRRVKVSITCKIQKEFYSKEKIIIEPRIIYQKHKELLYIKKYSSSEKVINCADFNQLEKETASKKYYSNYTFIQTNNFNIPNPGKITFRIIIYCQSPEVGYQTSFPVKIAYSKRRSTLRNLDDDDDVDIEEEKEDIDANCKKVDENKFGYYDCSADIDISNKSDVTNFYIESDDISGLFEGSSNPIETDQQIEKNLTINFSDKKSSDNLITLMSPYLFNDTENSCDKTGQFNITGKVDKNIAGGSFYIDYLNPPDIGAYCTFKDTAANHNLTMTCHNEDDFVMENIMIDKQLIGGKVYIDNSIMAGPLTCQIGDEFTAGSEYLSIEGEPEDSQNSTISDNGVGNQYYSKTKSSQGLSGGAITAIVIVSAFVLIGVGVLIALIKNGVFSPKPPVNNSTSIPPLTNSSANII